MDFTIDLILFTAIGTLFLCIVIGYYWLSQQLANRTQNIEQLLYHLNSGILIDIYTEVYKLRREIKDLQHLKAIKRGQTHSKKRERETLTLVRGIKRTINKPIRIKVHSHDRFN